MIYYKRQGIHLHNILIIVNHAAYNIYVTYIFVLKREESLITY